MARPRSHAAKVAQAAYEAEKLAAGAHIQINVKLKAATDVEEMKRLRARFSDLTDAGIARLALKELVRRGN